MEPNIHIDDVLEVDPGFYGSRPIQRFDIVLFNRIHKGPGPTDSFKVVARVIGLPGESLKIRDNVVFINDRTLNEPFKIRPCQGRDDSVPCAQFDSFKIPAGEYFLLADNRRESEDSRHYRRHSIPRSQIIGKVVRVISGSRKY
jgi:signal peptidase I